MQISIYYNGQCYLLRKTRLFIKLPGNTAHFCDRGECLDEYLWPWAGHSQGQTRGLGLGLGDNMELQENAWTDRSQNLSGCVTYHLEYNSVKKKKIKKNYKKSL